VSRSKQKYTDAMSYRLRVKEVAESKGITMAKLSRMADVSYNTTQALFKHPTHDASLYILDRIAMALGVHLCDLIEYTEKAHERE
jgi:DNA-binding Xre family transcriptional regulator